MSVPTPSADPAKAPLRDEPHGWPVLATRDLHRDDWIVALREDTVQRPGHPDDTFSRLVLEHPGAAIVLAVDDDQRVCCIRQYRHAGGGYFIEFPAGLLDTDGESALDTARRELREEAQLQAERWDHLLTTYASTGISQEQHHFYLARGLAHADRGDFEMHAEEAEIEVLWVPVEEVIDAVLAGRVREGPTAVAVLAYDALRRRGEV